MDHLVQRPVRTTTSSRDDLTAPPHKGPNKNQWNTSDSEVAGSATPNHTINRSSQTRPRHRTHRWIEAKERPLPPETVLTVVASSFGIVMGASPLLQIRKMLAERSSREVSIGYFAILALGSTLWGSYAVTIHNVAVFIPNVVAGLTAVATIAVAVNLRSVKEVVLAGNGAAE